MPVAADAKLRAYRQKRDFTKTAEPAGAAPPQADAGALRFVVQKHDATRLHYDFRLELDGVLLSWAVTKGPSTDPADKRLAVRVEDHPLDYGSFEGTIPAGQYGGGTVMLWDEGTWEPLGDPHQGLAKGDLKFILHGRRMKGAWVLVHMQGRDSKTRNGVRENWLLIKHHDADATDGSTLTEKFTTSVETGRDLAGIAKGNKPRRKAALIATPTQVWSGGKSRHLPAFREPELATLVDSVPTGRNWLFEMKYDGYRALAALAGDQVRLYTRNGNDWTAQFDALVAPLARLTPGDALIDGEIVALRDGRTDFSTLKDALSNGAPLTYFAFDLLERDGEDLTALPLTERKAQLRELLGARGKDDPIQFSEHITGAGEKFFAAMCQGGFEGVVAKLGTSPYRGMRCRDWLKIKCTLRQEFVIGGWRPSERKNTFASLLLGTWDNGTLVYRGRVGTGFDVEGSAKLQTRLDALARATSPFAELPRAVARQAHWIEPKLVAEIAFAEFTPDGYLRHPSYLGLREDKKAKDVKLETPAPAASGPARSPSDSPTFDDAAGIAAAKRVGVALTHPDRVVYPGDGVTKAMLVAYYAAVADRMLPHIVRRPLSLVRCPQGRAKACFFQKHDSGGFPREFRKVPITEKDGKPEDYLFIDGLEGLVAGVQMNTLEFHIWGSHVDDVDAADRIIFDIDPDEGLDFARVQAAAAEIRDRLAALGLKTFAMVTGGKGIHVIAPLRPTLDWPAVKGFCKAFAQKLEDDAPERFVANMSKAKRTGRMFVDYLRNERGATAIAPFSTRSREGAPCAVPVSWEELATLESANGFSLAEAAARAQAPDPWPDYFALRQSITPKMLKALTG